MQTLLVYAHPVPDSLNATLSRQAQQAIRERGWPLEVLDLNAVEFDPVMPGAERGAYYGGDTPPDDPTVAAMVDQLRRAELLVLVFPTWWFGFPAILKGWFDRIWRPGVAFDHSPDMGRLIPRLTNLRHVVAITTMGSPLWVDLLILRQPLRRVLRWSSLKPCAPQAKLHWLALHGAETVTRQRVDTFSAKIARAIDALGKN